MMWFGVICTESPSHSSVIFEGIFPEARLIDAECFSLFPYTIILWFPCLDGLIQIRGNVARVKKSARKHEPKASDFARFS
jgi:hypothetical protein